MRTALNASRSKPRRSMIARLERGEVLLTTPILEVGRQVVVAVVPWNVAAGQFVSHLKPIQPGQFSSLADAESLLSVESTSHFDQKVARHLRFGHVHCLRQ